MLGISLWHMLLGFLMRDVVMSVTAAGRSLTLGIVSAGTIIVSTYTDSVASALTAQALSSNVGSLADIMSGKVSPARVGLQPNSAHSAWFTAHVSTVFTPIENVDA